MKPACHLSGWRVNTDTPMYKKTKFSARKLPSSNSCKIMHTAAVSQEKNRTIIYEKFFHL